MFYITGHLYLWVADSKIIRRSVSLMLCNGLATAVVLNIPSHTSRCSEKLCSLVNHRAVTKLSANTLTQQCCYGPKQNSLLVRLSLKPTYRPCPYCTNRFATQCQYWWECVHTALSKGQSSQWRKGRVDNVPRIWDKVVSKACADAAGNTHWRLSMQRIAAQHRNLGVHDHLQVREGKTSHLHLNDLWSHITFLHVAYPLGVKQQCRSMISNLMLRVWTQRSHCLIQKECSRKSQPHHTPNLKHSLHNSNENWVIKNRHWFQSRCSTDQIIWTQLTSSVSVCIGEEAKSGSGYELY